MGYYMHTKGVKVFIACEDKQAALDVVRALMANPVGASGWGPGGKHYAFVNNARPETWTSLEDALLDWRWQPEVDDAGNIVGLSFEGEKIGDDDILFASLSPFIRKGSYITMVGEDGATWDFLA